MYASAIFAWPDHQQARDCTGMYAKHLLIGCIKRARQSSVSDTSVDVECAGAVAAGLALVAPYIKSTNAVMEQS
jgi:hypothetical protein